MGDRVNRSALVLLLVICAQSCASPRDERSREKGAAGALVLARLSPGALPALRDSFNAAQDSVRILVMLSPT